MYDLIYLGYSNSGENVTEDEIRAGLRSYDPKACEFLDWVKDNVKVVAYWWYIGSDHDAMCFAEFHPDDLAILMIVSPVGYLSSKNAQRMLTKTLNKIEVTV